MKTWILMAALATLTCPVFAGTVKNAVPDEKERTALLMDIEVYRDILLPKTTPAHPLTVKYGPQLDRHKAAVMSARTVVVFELAKRGYDDWKREVLVRVRSSGLKPGPRGESFWKFRTRMADEAQVRAAERQMYASRIVEAQTMSMRKAFESRTPASFNSLYDGSFGVPRTPSFSSPGLAGFATTPASDGAVRAETPPENDPARYAKVRALLLSKGVDPRVIDAAIAEGRRQKVDPMIVLSVIDQESNFKRTARNKGSGARGLMQLAPGTAADMGVKNAGLLYDIKTNIRAGVKYLNWIANSFFKMNLDMSNLTAVPAEKLKIVLASYNWGIGNVQKSLRRHGAEALERVAPKETRNYIAEIPERIYSWFASF
ncbi:MAG: hypothetical protein COV48_11880 [Elusimicrobia bacterium CG11_big_fil_rev_8_21_14_0_20_64_6]|nr:MAG: hypothetical protein COV48_11880 [Elusimicrobia bacterium CG11_big_fil_rev_8_21_14_0_20_64_6]